MSTAIETLVKTGYSSHAKSNETGDFANYNTLVASAFGYSPDELASLPTNANLGLSCGNPLATANLKSVRQTQSSLSRCHFFDSDDKSGLISLS